VVLKTACLKAGVSTLFTDNDRAGEARRNANGDTTAKYHCSRRVWRIDLMPMLGQVALSLLMHFIWSKLGVGIGIIHFHQA